MNQIWKARVFPRADTKIPYFEGAGVQFHGFRPSFGYCLRDLVTGKRECVLVCGELK